MQLPVEMRPLFYSLSPEAQISISTDYNRRRKSKGVAYFAWLLLGWHYLYLRRVPLQFAFWFTAGGFLVWWVIDAFRIGSLVDRMNEDTARELMVQYNALMPGGRPPDPQMHFHVGPTPMPGSPRLPDTPTPSIAARTIDTSGDTQVAESEHFEDVREAPRRRPAAPKIAFATAAALAVGFAAYAMVPSTKSAAADPTDVSFTVMKDTNVRSGPTTENSIIGAVVVGEKVSGKVELGPKQIARWLRVDSGPHSGGYISLTHLRK